MTEPNQTLPGHETQSQEMNCPACGRFVGAVVKCPYCGAKVTKRMSLMVTRWAAVLLATVGLFLLYLMAKHRDIPVVPLNTVQPTMNFAQIRVVGTVDNDARPFRSGMGMSFNVDDGTGKITVFITKKQMDELIEENMVPKAGDSINFAGGLSVSDEQMSMRLLSVKEMKLERAPVLSVRLADIDHSMAGTSISVAGKVSALVSPPTNSRRPYELKINDGTDERLITFWQSEYDQIANPEALAGAYIRARVSVARYQKTLQLKLASGQDIEILDQMPEMGEVPKTPAQKAATTYEQKKTAAAPQRDFSRGRQSMVALTPLADISADQEGKTVRVQGVVRQVYLPEAGSKAPYSVTLRDGEASLRAVYWSNVHDVIAESPSVGATFQMEGTVEAYEGKPQLKVTSGYTVKRVSASSADAPAATFTFIPLANLSGVKNAQQVNVRGVLGPQRDLGGKGVAYTLTEDGDSVDLVIWNDTLSADFIPLLKEGAQVLLYHVQLGEYQGKQQVKAGKSTTVRVAP
ncbi:MAG: hypothetical protein LBN38_03250 [Verrucomicrobiota bacterium]|nr:hypothetical protein [Verrucomicrobiota bacterium]